MEKFSLKKNFIFFNNFLYQYKFFIFFVSVILFIIFVYLTHNYALSNQLDINLKFNKKFNVNYNLKLKNELEIKKVISKNKEIKCIPEKNVLILRTIKKSNFITFSIHENFSKKTTFDDCAESIKIYIVHNLYSKIFSLLYYDPYENIKKKTLVNINKLFMMNVNDEKLLLELTSINSEIRQNAANISNIKKYYGNHKEIKNLIQIVNKDIQNMNLITKNFIEFKNYILVEVITNKISSRSITATKIIGSFIFIYIFLLGFIFCIFIFMQYLKFLKYLKR